MYAARPMLVVPFSHDQPDNAERAQRLGIGRALPRARFSVPAAVAALGELLADPRYATAATDVARTLAARGRRGGGLRPVGGAALTSSRRRWQNCPPQDPPAIPAARAGERPCASQAPSLSQGPMSHDSVQPPHVRQDTHRLRRAFLLSVSFAAVLWWVKMFEALTPLDLVRYGVYPRRLSGLLGIFTAPFIHGSLAHLLSNTAPIVILGTALLYGYPKSARLVIPALFLGYGAGRLAVRPRVLSRRRERPHHRHPVLRLRERGAAMGAARHRARRWRCSSSTAA